MKKYLKSVITILLCSFVLTTGTNFYNTADAENSAKTFVVQSSEQLKVNVKPLDVVNSPKFYLNKKISMNVKFDKFSTLGLDYKTAMRSSEKYISFLIQRDDVTHNIPLSEMKLFLKREEAEKFIDLKTDDEIYIEGVVFSDALGDPWVDVTKLVITKPAPKENGAK